MTEALCGAHFEYIECHSTVPGFQNGTHMVYLFTTGWERSNIQPKSRFKATKKRHLKDFLTPNLVRYIEDGTYWINGIGEKSNYLDKNQFENTKENELSDDDSGLESGY